nr:unnamed protein product [Callosobruchus chinensis]
MKTFIQRNLTGTKFDLTFITEELPSAYIRSTILVPPFFTTCTHNPIFIWRIFKKLFAFWTGNS